MIYDTVHVFAALAIDIAGIHVVGLHHLPQYWGALVPYIVAGNLISSGKSRLERLVAPRICKCSSGS